MIKKSVKGGKIIVILSFFIVLLLMAQIFSFTTNAAPVGLVNNPKLSENYNATFSIEKTLFVPVKAAYGSVNSNATFPYSRYLNVLVTFSLVNQSKLMQFLANISNPNNPQYHKYITRAQFESEFSISQQNYSKAVSYFKNFPGLNVMVYADRVSIEISGPASEIGKAFNTTICTTSVNDKIYYARSSPELPSYLATIVSQVTGLTNYKLPISTNLFVSSASITHSSKNFSDGGYPLPVNQSGVQYIYGSDLQVAYDEQSLLNITYPTNEVIATILWSGYNSSGAPVGPFYPADIYSYFNATLPPYEPHSRVYGVPLNGAPKPGILASYDVSGATFENTLDLEMVGSMASGSSIYNVYGPNATGENLDAALAFILNPNSTYSALNNVSVISNSWGSTEYNDTAWYEYLQEAQARGISVLASSGDAGDNTASSKYSGSILEFPSAMSYNTFGVTAVGGTTLTLTNNLHILNQTAWYISANDTENGGPAGSEGGISTIFPEPDYQLNSEANNILNGEGRGVPDISAIANNTFIFKTVNGTSNFYQMGGTSVASPVEAGIVAEMDAVLNYYNQSNLGFLNPLIYNLANRQITSPPVTSTIGFGPTGTYNSSLPTLPFYNVIYGRNHMYNATFGYNLVTGWGSIDAYNFTMYVLNINFTNSTTKLKGVYDSLTLNGLNVTSYFYNSTTGTYSTINYNYNASIQQNLFLANQFGAPIYWIQNVIYINGPQSNGWMMIYTGWVIYPFYGLYPNEALYEYNFPLGETLYLPHTWNISTWLTNYSIPLRQTVNFEVNSHIISLPVPGAAYIIGEYNYSYQWQGETYYNGPYPNNPYPGGLDPQIGLVGGPSGGLGVFGPPTRGSLSCYVEPFNLNYYIPAATASDNGSVDQTGEGAENLNYINTGGNNWNITIENGSEIQGILSYVPQEYQVTFYENGLPSGTNWSVTLGGITKSSSTNTIIFSVPNGSYSYSVVSVSGYISSPSSGTITVNGTNVNQAITFTATTEAKYVVTFAESGLPSGTRWYVNLSNGQSFSSTGTAISLDEPNGSYSYTVATANKNYAASISSGTLTVNGANVQLSVTFSLVAYIVTFTESGLSSGTTWSVTLNGATSSSSTSTISFSEPNGSYSYSIGSVSGYTTSPSSGTITVNGANVNQAIKFSEVTYTVTFTESGLPTGTTWYVNLSNGQSFSSTTSIISFSESNGSYTYTIATNNKIFATSPSSGSFTVNGASVSESITFSEVTYKVTFTESGLSSGRTWYVNLSNGQSFTSTNSTITFKEPNGTYSYIIGTVNKIYAPTISSGTFTVNGANVQVSITFYEVTYGVTFTENGLPSGTKWYVNLSNGQSFSSNTSRLTFNEPNGTYSYTIAINNKIYSPSQSSGQFTVNGVNISVAITFSEVTYTVTFTESGLSSGTTWSVTLNGATETSTANTISFSEPNGSYSYSIGSVSGYIANPSSGTITVNGANVNQAITFTATVQTTYTITFTENGLPTGSSWSVTLNGITKTSTNSTITFNEPNGTYSYTIVLPSGYNTTSSSGSVSTTQSITNIPVSVTSTSTTPSPSSSPTNYLLIVIVIVIVVIIAIVGGTFVMRRGKKKGGPKQWQEPTKEKSEEEKK